MPLWQAASAYHGGLTSTDLPVNSQTDGAYLAASLVQQRIAIRGARTHNLKNIDLDIPRNRLVVITGLSGSGKSSLAFDTLYAEGQRRYVESLSAYARQFLQLMDKPDVDVIEGLSPAISIEQKATSHNPRSTVGTVTEIHDYLRLLFARAGTPHCPTHGVALTSQTVSQMVDAVLALPEDTRLMILAPVARERKGEFEDLFAQMQAQGYIRFRINGESFDVDNLPKLKKTEKHDIDVVIDRIKVRPDVQQRLAESFEAALRLAEGRAVAMEMDTGKESFFNAKFACPVCHWSISELEPRLFSFNSPVGACPTCDGLGHSEYFDPQRVVAFPTLSLASGAIKGWDRRNAYYFSLIESLARHFGFDPEEPFERLPAAVRQAILQGTGEEAVKFSYTMESGAAAGRKVSKNHPFEGIIPNMARRWRETDSTAVRDDLGRLRSVQPCPSCAGARLRIEARHVKIGEGEDARAIYEVSHATLRDAYAYFQRLKLKGAKAEIAEKVIREIGNRLKFLNDVGLSYLSLDRSAETLSGGEAQRIRLASQIGSGLTGVMYVLDEPSIGLHQRDNDRLLETLKRLRDLGNKVIVVEHDEDAIRHADHIVDLGPGAGVHGGEIVAQGTLADILASPDSLTGQYLTGARRIEVPAKRRKGNGHKVTVHNARANNLRGVTASIPLGTFTCITGLSGSGKSSLIIDTLQAGAARVLNGARVIAGPHDKITGLEFCDKVIEIDQSPIGRTPRSNPATYTGAFTQIRDWFAGLPESGARGYKPGRFSFNVKGGRCEKCQGDGLIKIEMHFLPDVYVTCEECSGRRYNRETLEVKFKGHSIADVLDMTIEDAEEFFKAVPPIRDKMHMLNEVGLGYVKVGQQATTLSGGEAQRVKLAKELSRRSTGQTLYILDEPTTGLHFEDVRKLLEVLQRLVDQGNSVVVIEHNLDVIKVADWVIDLGPEGGVRGGEIVAEGTPETVAANARSFTGQYLAGLLERGRVAAE